MSAVRSSRSRSAIASASMPSMPSVPLIRARPSLAASLDGFEADRGERLGGGAEHAVRVPHLALPDQRERAVRERREVAGAAERAVLVHDRGDAVVQQPGEQPRRHRAYAGVAGRHRREPQQHEPPDHLALDLGPRAGGVRAHQRALQPGPQVGRDVAGGEGPEPGRDAVRRHRRPGQCLDHGPGAGERLLGLVGEGDSGAVTGHGHHLGEGDRTGADDHVRSAHTPHGTPSPRPPPAPPAVPSLGYETSGRSRPPTALP